MNSVRRNDEARHVHFGLIHVRHALANDSGLYQRLENAVRRRASTMANILSALHTPNFM